MMQVNLFAPSQDHLPVSSQDVLGSASHTLKSGCLSLDNPIGDTGDLLAFNHKPQVSNNNDAVFSKDIYTIAQGNDKAVSNCLKGRRLNSPDHPKTVLEAAKQFCIDKEFTDVYIQCEDGTMAAHSVILSIASPFLKRLLEAELYSMAESVRGREPICLVLPDVKTSLVQALLEFLYTGKVTTQEGQFYSLMKLVYDLDINASIEAEKTSDQPSKFEISPVVKNNNDFECQSCRPRKRARMDTFDSTFNALFEASNNVQNTGKSINMTSHESLSLWPKSGGLVVNSLTASGVEVKQEPDEKPSLSEEREFDPTDLRRVLDKTSSSSQGLTSGVNALSTNSVNNNQLGHFVSVNPGYQVKLELPPNSAGHMLASPPQNQIQNTKDSSNPDDPLAAIMNQTIFGGEGLNMYIQVGGNVSSFVNKPMNQGPSKNVDKDRDSGTRQVSQPQDSTEDIAGLTEDDDTTSSYNCDTCNRVMKGKVMLQAHKYQEHHENPEFEASSFPDDKYACRVCLKLFTRNSDVKAHILRVHCGDRRYPCTLCGKRFKESTHLRKHLYTHTGERPHFCSYCSKGFQTSSDLKRHKKTRVHQERVDQCNAERSHSTPETPTEKNLDTGLDFNRWNDGEDDDLESTLNSAASRSSSSPFGNMSTGRSQPSTPPFSSVSNQTLGSPGTQSNLTFTTSASQFIQLPPRMVFSSPSPQQVPFLGEPVTKNAWPPSQQGILIQNQNIPENQNMSSVGMPSSPLADVLSSLPPQNLGVQNLTLPSTTLDLSDIKWGILDPTVSIKRSGSTDSPAQEDERLTIQEDL